MRGEAHCFQRQACEGKTRVSLTGLLLKAGRGGTLIRHLALKPHTRGKFHSSLLVFCQVE
eukprot:m.168428 g.168428  ORF g.168428 m.168428 type:complete len:60 (+) comp38953_c1_seq51:235-414(+)